MSRLLVVAVLTWAMPGAVETPAGLPEGCPLMGGVAWLPHAADAPRATALAQGGRFLVLGDRTGLPEAGAAVADGSASLVYVGDLTDASLEDAQRDRWLRALSPQRGLAILGNPSAKVLSPDRLRAWLAHVPETLVASGTDGVWARCRVAVPEGAAAWTHKFADAANTRTANDPAFAPPFLPAWYALPLHLGFWGDTLVADGGRAYLVWANQHPSTPVSLLAVDVRSGQRLWEQPFAWEAPRQGNQAGYYPGRSCLVAQGDALFVIDGPAVRELDGETGALRRRLAGPRPDGQVKWIAIADGQLAVLAGEADVFASNQEFKGDRVLQQKVDNPVGRSLAVIDLATGAQRWRIDAEGDIDERELAIRDGRLFYHVRGRHVVCRALATGAVEWCRDEPTVVQALAADTANVRGLMISARCLAATPQALVFAAAWMPQRVGLSPADGHLLWTLPKQGRRMSMDVIFDGRLLDSKGAYDLATGAPVRGLPAAPADGCGACFAANRHLVSPQGRVVGPDGVMVRRLDLKSACDLGVVVSQGVALSPPSVCTCPMEVQGFRAFVPAAVQPTPVAARWQRVTPVGEDGVAAVAGDWPTAQHDVRRSGATPSQVSAKPPTQAWCWKPAALQPVARVDTATGARQGGEAEFLPTQMITVDGTGWFADADGVLRAVDLATGAERWHQALGYRLFAPPAYAAGRLVVGGSDGVVQAFDAVTGAVRWRYQVAPQPRRIAWYGQLLSTWPLTGGVVVDAGVVYAVAGFQAGNGVFAAALDLRDGHPLWERGDAGGTGVVDAIGCMGDLALAGNRLCFASGGPWPGVLDRATGAPQVVSEDRFGRLRQPRTGARVAALGDDLLLMGGKRLAANFAMWTGQRARMGQQLVQLHAPGAGVQLGDSLVAPVFDDRVVVLTQWGGSRNRLVVHDRARLLAAATAAPGAKPTLAELPAGQPTPLWQSDALSAFDLVLAGDVLLLVHPRGHDRREQMAWQLSAHARDSGQVLWTIDLPCRPAWNGLSVDRQGRILVALWNGAVACYR